MKKRTWFDNIVNKCDKCGCWFGKHDLMEHLFADTHEQVKKILDNPQTFMPENVMPQPIRLQSSEPQFMTSIVNLSAKVDTSKKCAVEVSATSPDFMVDFGHWLDVFGFMTHRAMKYQEWSKEKIIAHVGKELSEWIDTYEEERKKAKHATQTIQK